MTLAVAALFPWQELEDSLPNSVQRILEMYPKFRPQKAILMTADSRWSYVVGQDFDDGGVKLARVHPHGAAIYAGNTAAGEKALARLRAAFLTVRSGNPVAPQQTLRAVWREHSHQGGGLHVCLGFFDAEDQPHLVRFDDEDDFLPKDVTGVQPLGWHVATAYFLGRLGDEVGREMSIPLTEQALDLSGEHWSALIARLVWETCQEKVDPTVGGPILSVIITREGVQGRSLYSVDSRTNPPTVNCLSLTPSEVETFYKRQMKRSPSRRPPRYVEPASKR